MGTFSAIRTAFTAAVTSAYPSDKQVFGTVDQISQTELGEGQDLFGFYSGYKVLPDLQGNADTTQDVGFYCGELDSSDSTADETNLIIDRMEAKAKAIIDAFESTEQANAMSVTDFTITPYYKGLNDTTSGVWCLISLKVNQAQFC